MQRGEALEEAALEHARPGDPDRDQLVAAELLAERLVAQPDRIVRLEHLLGRGVEFEQRHVRGEAEREQHARGDRHPRPARDRAPVALEAVLDAVSDA